MSIPRSFINDLLARLDIVEIITSRIGLKKAGSNFVTQCPFHTEKTPSFNVNPGKQFFYCFGCGAHGDAIKFVMQFDRLDFIDAVTSLAASVGLEVPRDTLPQANTEQVAQNVSSYELLKKLSLFYRAQLTRSEKAKSYLKTRQVSDEVGERFVVGYAPSLARPELLKLLPNARQLLVANGILIQKDDGDIYERFRDRVMFPIRNVKGQVIAFGGRVLGDAQPKYLNSPETALFHKGDELYGLYEARHANQKLEKLIVVEGYMDVVALAQHGINYAVATMGTAITPKHVQKLLREVNHIVYCFDGDAAGRHAAWRALEITLPLMRDGIQVQFLFLPAVHDPDSFIRAEGQTAFVRCLHAAILLSDFFFDYLCTGLDLDSIDGRAALVKKAKELLDKMPNGVFKEMLWQRLSKLVRMEVAILKGEAVLAPENRYIKPRLEQQHENLVERAIMLVLHHPILVQNLDVTEKLTKIGKLPLLRVDLLLWLVDLLHQRPNIVSMEILDCCTIPEDAEFLARMLVNPPLISKDFLQNEFLGIMNNLCMRDDEKIIESLMQRARRGELGAEEKQRLQALIKRTK